MGAHLNAYTSREQTVYYSQCHANDVESSVSIMADILQNSLLDKPAIDRERDVILTEQVEIDKNCEEFVFDHLHATAFQHHPLGRTILGTKENIKTIDQKMLRSYIDTFYSPERTVLVGAGKVDHEEMIKLGEKYFASLPAPNTLYTGNRDKPNFVGSEIRLRDDDMKQAHIALAVEGVSWSSPDYFEMLILGNIVGQWDRALGSASSSSFKLAREIHEDGIANSYMAFNTSYSDTGLWGIYMVSENVTHLDDVVFYALREWTRLCTNVLDSEIERAKTMLKANLLFSMDGTSSIAEDIGRQIVTTRVRIEPTEAAKLIDKITPERVREVANKYLWDKELAMVAYGPIECVPDYSRLRANMSLNRY